LFRQRRGDGSRQCGHTPQYEGLEALYRKIPVKGKEAHPLYAELAKTAGMAPRWNFHKYLVDRSGSKVLSFGTRVEPDDPKLVAAIERLLQGR
jgi:glutathione peroxidase